MNRSSIQPIPPFFDRYINLVEDINILDALKQYHVSYLQQEYKSLKNLGDKVYAPGKWTVKDILQHLIDNERIMAYRALRVGRNDPTPLPGYDQDVITATANSSKRTVGELLREFELVRETTIILFETFDDEMLKRLGNCNNTQMSALALGFVIVGHVIHHMNIIKDKYYPLI